MCSSPALSSGLAAFCSHPLCRSVSFTLLRAVVPLFTSAILVCLSVSFANGQQLSDVWRRYFEQRVEQIEHANQLSDEQLADWPATQTQWRSELRDMLGLNPEPDRSDLQAEVTGSNTSGEIVVENLHFQSLPGLYVTANLYRPTKVDTALPAVLYLCGHGAVKQDGVSYGNKVHYHHHGVWLAEHGFVCLILDSLQLGEIEGIHHGTYRYERWWWVNRGYTPAGVEAWNCIRALDYLATRPEVDMNRVGCTGRSGGGAYSWWIAALDPRISVAIPVAGITDLRNHVVDDCVEGHCDCMFFVNRFGWDYPRVAQIIAPRALMIANSDYDSIFPLDGVQRTYWQTRQVYETLGESNRLALTITPGPHADTQDLRVPAFRWLNHHLKQTDELLDSPAVKRFEPMDLKVFRQLPEDEINTRIDESFVPAVPSPAPPASADAWLEYRHQKLDELTSMTFRSWPTEAAVPAAQEVSHGDTPLPFVHYRLETQGPLEVDLHLLNARRIPSDGRIQVCVLDTQQHQQLTRLLNSESDLDQFDWNGLGAGLDPEIAIVTISPRGLGDLAGPTDPKAHTQWLRRFYLLGETLESGQVWDIRQALKWIVSQAGDDSVQLELYGRGSAGIVAGYASLFAPAIDKLVLSQPPSTHQQGPYLPNVQRVLDIADVLAWLASQCRLEIHDAPVALIADLQAYQTVLQQQFPTLTSPDK